MKIYDWLIDENKLCVKAMFCHTIRVCCRGTDTFSDMLLLFTRPLSRDGGMVEVHGASEAGKLSRAWTRGRKETENRQRVSSAESVAGQCRMRRVSAGAAGRILDSPNPREIRA